MGRVDELRAQLAAVELEEAAVADLVAAKEAFRAAPSPEGDAVVRAASEVVRAVRAEARAGRGRGVRVVPDVAVSAAAVKEV